MTMALKQLTKQTWKDLKKNAKITNAGILQTDAASRKHIEAYQAARTKYMNDITAYGRAMKASTDRPADKGKGFKHTCEYLNALRRLRKAFEDFVKAKDFNTALARNLQNDIRTW